jgi:hypothetical protein
MEFPATSASALLLVFFGISLPLTLVFAIRARAKRLPAFRPLPGIAQLRAHMSDVSESGKPLHVATGASQPGVIGPTAETIASLLIAQRITEETIRRGGKVALTSGDIVAHTALRGTLHQAYRQAGFASDYQGDAVQLVAQNTPVSYAAGVAARYAAEPVAASMIAGNYGAEALLISEEGAARGVWQVAATSSLDALPVLAISADATLIGEELFAAEAYLSEMPGPKARLLTQDALRWMILVLLVIGIIWQVLALVQPGLSLPALS